MVNLLGKMDQWWGHNMSQSLAMEQAIKMLHKDNQSSLLLGQEVDKRLCEEKFSYFVRGAWNIIEPGTGFLSNWHVEYVAEHLELVTEGKIQRLIINIPPKYLKSILVSVMWPVWSWAKKPSIRWIFCSHAQDLTIRDSRKRRQIMQDPWFVENWGHKVRFAPDQNQKTEFENMEKGSMICKSVGAAAIGRGGNFIVIDDPLNPQDALSEVKRKEANRWIDESISTRLDDKATGAIVLIMQRLHEDDVTGHLLSKKDADGTARWQHISIPAEAEGRTVIHFPKSGKEIVREDGEPIFAKRESKELLTTLRTVDLGSYAYAGQYQQRPSPLGGGVIKSEWWRFYSEDPGELEYYLQSWDMSFKETKDGSYVVGQVWGKRGSRFYLLDQIRSRCDFVKAKFMVKAMTDKWPQTAAKLVEDKANGPAIISSLAENIPGIIPINPKGSKEARLHAVSPYIEAGNVFLPSKELNPWVDAYILEFDHFPNGLYDDQIDATSQALKFLPKELQTGADDKPVFGAPRMSSTGIDVISTGGMNPY